MRRNDREITDKKLIEAFIAGEQILRVGFYDEGEIYIVPVTYGYLKDKDVYTFYFHGAKAGRKYGLAKASPLVGFEIDGKYRLIEGESACRYSASFQSVIGTGRLSLVEDRAEKIAGLNAIMKQVSGKESFTYDEKTLAETAVFRLRAEKLSCKAK
ncbi:MAG: pyridoxamine 5'-phosphate oxidase family protein [Ruminiclostridium sp.]